MATQSSFKQPCPSCEAMVPIRDPKLIGRKIDCPKCKYRFVVEEPADEVEEVEEFDDDEPASKKGKGKANGITNKKPTNGKAVKPAARRRPDDDEDEEEAPPKKKKSGGSPMLIIGIGLAAVAVVALAVGGIFLFSGDKSDNKPSGPSANRGAANFPPTEEKPPTPAGNAEDKTPKPRQEDITNLLPNDAQAVLNLPVDQLFTNARVNQALLKAPGAFHEAGFQRVWGIPPGEVRRVVLACNPEKNTVFSVLRTRAPLKEDQIVARLQLKAEAPIGGLKYYLLKKPLDSLSRFLLQDAIHLLLRGSPGQHDKVALHFIDPFTFVCADAVAMNQFLQEKGQPKHLSKPPEEEAPSNDAQGGPGGPGGMGPGGPGSPPGGPPGAPPRPGGPPGASQGPGGPNQPPSTGRANNGPPSTGRSGGPPSTGRAGGGPPSTGSSGGPFPPGSSGGPFPPGASPNMPPGMAPGGGFPGSNTGGPGDAAPVSSSYLTVEQHLKDVLDQVEKADKQEGENVMVSFAFNTGGTSPEDAKKMLTLLGNKVPNVPEENFKSALEFVESNIKVAGLAVTAFSDSKFNVNAALFASDAKRAKAWETTVHLASELISNLLEQHGLDLVAKTNSNNGQNMPGMGPRGMNPGNFPPGQFPPGQFPPGQGGFPGGFPGMQPPDGESKEEKGKDGEYVVWTKDEVFALGVQYKMTKSRYNRAGTALEFAGIYLRSMTALSDRSSHVHELAAAIQAYVEKEGHFPRGTIPRATDSVHVIDWRPDQRLSWLTLVLPYLGNGEFQNLRLDPNKTWYEDTANEKAGFTLIPQFLASNAVDSALVPYPNLPTQSPSLWAATHFVGMAGVGLDAAEYRNGDAATAKLRGVFGYDRETKKDDIKDGLDQTIVAIQVPPEPRSPWIAGGGSTVRGISDDLDCLRPFVCAKYTNKDGKEEDGTFAIMADGKVRFIPAKIDPKTFQALCTIAGGDKVKNLDAIAPEVPPPEDMPQQPELKAEAPPPSSPAQAPPAEKSAGWTTYTSKEGGFTVSLPAGKNLNQNVQVNTPAGKLTIHIHGVELPGNAGSFVTMYTDYPNAVLKAGTDPVFEGAKSGVSASLKGGKITGEAKITIEGHPGREWTIEAPGQGSMKARVFIVKTRLIQLLAGGESGKLNEKDVQTFFDSLRLAK